MLDCKTEKGQIEIQRQHEAVSLLRLRFPSMLFAETRDEEGRPADLDFIAFEGGLVSALGEVRSRDLTSEALFGRFGGELMVTEAKLVKGIELAHRMATAFIMVWYAWPEKRIFVEPIINRKGELVATWHLDRRTTQATVNGGTKESTVALVKATTKGWTA